MPAGNSIAKEEKKYIPLKAKGFKLCIVFTILLSLLTNNTSIGKRIKKVWMELHGFKTIACPDFSSFLPKSPRIREKRVSAIRTSWAKIVFFVLLIKRMQNSGLWGFKDTFGKSNAA